MVDSINNTLLAIEIPKFDSHQPTNRREEFTVKYPGSMTAKFFSYIFLFIGICFVFAGNYFVGILWILICLLIINFSKEFTFIFTDNTCKKCWKSLGIKISFQTIKIPAIKNIIITNKSRKYKINSIIYEYEINLYNIKGQYIKIETVDNKSKSENIAKELSEASGCEIIYN